MVWKEILFNEEWLSGLVISCRALHARFGPRWRALVVDVKDRESEVELVLEEVVLHEVGSAPILPQNTAKPQSTQWPCDHLTRILLVL